MKRSAVKKQKLRQRATRKQRSQRQRQRKSDGIVLDERGQAQPADYRTAQRTSARRS